MSRCGSEAALTAADIKRAAAVAGERGDAQGARARARAVCAINRGGADARIGIGARVELGASGTVRYNASDRTTSFAFGPSIGVVPAKNMLLMVGYNFAGYRDADFSAANNTTKGVFATLKMKFDTGTFGFLGLDKRVRH